MAIDLSQLQELLNNASTSAANEKEIRKSLVRVENLIGNVQQEVTHIYALLDGSAEPRQRKPRATKAVGEAGEVDADAPYGRKADGSPKAKPGRAKAETAAE